MTRTFHMEPGRVYGEHDGVSFFDTAAYPVQYANSVLTVSGLSLVWPDFQKGNAYCWAQWDAGDGNPTESCISLVTIAGQEWGPASTNPTSGCQIDDVLLGTVPGGADHLLVRVKASRTANPSQINGNTIPVMVKQGQWTLAYGGSLLLEWINPIARMIQVYLSTTVNGDGTKNVYLRKLQSTKKERQSFYRSSNDYNKTGWTYGGAYGSAYGIPVSGIQARGPSTDFGGVGGRMKRSGSLAASVADPTNYSSTYSLDFEIIPGRSNITPVQGTGDGSAQFGFVDEQAGAFTLSSHSRTIQLGDPDADGTRKIIVAVSAYNPVTSTRGISSVTLGGVAMTQKAYVANLDASMFIVGIYVIDAPTGTSDTLVINFSGGTVLESAVTVYAGYRMNSATPDGVIQSSTENSATNLATVDGGLALAINAVGVRWDAATSLPNGESRYFVDPMETQAGAPYDETASNSVLYTRSHQLTDGTTLSLKQKALDGSYNPYDIRVSWVAASFH